MKLILLFLALFSTVPVYAQRQLTPIKPVAAQDDPTPVEEPDPVAIKLKSLKACNVANADMGTWQLFIIGDSDADRLNFVKALDLISTNPFAASSSFEKLAQSDVVVRKTKIYFKLSDLEGYRQLAVKNNNQALLEKIESEFSVERLLKDLLAIENLQIICNHPPIERSMSPARSGVIGSN